MKVWVTAVLFFLACLLAAEAVSNSTQSKKKGLVIPYWPRHRCGDFEAFSTVGWWYNYHSHKDPTWLNDGENKWWCNCPEGSEHACLPQQEAHQNFQPMIVGIPGHGLHPDWDEPSIEDWYSFILGYNEPNQPDQANIPPRKAAEEWILLQEKYPDKLLVSPATGHADTEWFDAFWEACQELGCRIDYLATHMYDGDADLVMETLEAYSKRYGNKKIWFTEFAKKCTHSEEEIVAFIEDLLPRLEAAPFVFRYAWWYTRYYPGPVDEETNPWFWLDPVNSLLEDEASVLTAVGRAYDFPYHLYV